MKQVGLLVIVFALLGMHQAGAQMVTISFAVENWNTEGAKVTLEEYKGKQSLLFNGGIIYFNDLDFKDGVIEVDMSFPQQRNFPGIIFRLQDRANFETFYVRPHQSGNPDATQYIPIMNGNDSWQLYHGEGYSAAFNFKFEQWHHFKIVVHGIAAEIYIDDMQAPILKVTDLKRGWQAGKIGFQNGNTPVRFANLQYNLNTTEPAPAALPAMPNGKDGNITQWQVSNVVGYTLFEDKYLLDQSIKSALTWTTRSAESSGIINLAKYGKRADKLNTMVTRVTIESDKDQVKGMMFGFSDIVTVYLNDRVLYLGKDNFMSRDYRFLGTVGFFDRLFLPLKKGRNELWLVVTEQFGGWGVKAKFENMDGIRLR